MEDDPAWLRQHRPRRYVFRILSAERRAERVAAFEARPVIPFETIEFSVMTSKAKRQGEKFDPQLRNRQIALKRRLAAAQQGNCYLCGDPMERITEDHVVPRHMGGKSYGNVLAACQACNVRKAHRAPHPCERLYLWIVNVQVIARAKPRRRGAPMPSLDPQAMISHHHPRDLREAFVAAITPPVPVS